MPDPQWTADYNYGNTPEQNGFTRVLVDNPSVNEIISGNPANRRVEIDTTPASEGDPPGQAIFITSNQPSLDPTIGATAEARVRVSGSGDAGFELTFNNSVVLVNIYENLVNVSIPVGDAGHQSDPGTELDLTVGPNNVDTLFRVLYHPIRTVSLYRNGVLIAGPINATTVAKPLHRVLWWGEGGGVQVFNGMRFYVGGAVAPG